MWGALGAHPTFHVQDNTDIMLSAFVSIMTRPTHSTREAPGEFYDRKKDGTVIEEKSIPDEMYYF